MTDQGGTNDVIDPRHTLSLYQWDRPEEEAARMKSNVVLEMGWGRLIFGHTFDSNEELAATICRERPGQRDIAWYLRDPHVVLSLAPQELFLDPSHTYRLWLDEYRPRRQRGPQREQRLGFRLRRPESRADVDQINRIYAARQMVQTDAHFVLGDLDSPAIRWLLAENVNSGEVIGTVTGVDHVKTFGDPDNGASLWCLAVDPQAQFPGVGQALVRELVEGYLARQRAYVDLSVMHDNEQAIALYEKLGFQRIPVFCIKRKNAINEPLYIAPRPEARLNPYAQIIITEARHRGIVVEVLDEQAGYFKLHFGGRSIICRESLTDLTTAIAMSRCEDKRVTLRVLQQAGLSVPAQQRAGEAKENRAFLKRHGRIVVKPAYGEQGHGISVDVRKAVDMTRAIKQAQRVSREVILEEFVQGMDLRIVVIDYQVVAAAVRRPAQVTGTGQHTVAQLIEAQSRRRAAATGGESCIPVDSETLRCVREAGWQMDSVLPAEVALEVRRTANLHTGGTIHDVTEQLHPALAEAAVTAAVALDIPVTGLDFIVPRVDGPEYRIIEANERPGLANHEPQPTAERFIDFLFPQTRAAPEIARSAHHRGRGAA